MSFDFNPLDPAVRRNPFDTYARGRDLGIVDHTALPLPMYSIFRYEDVQSVLRDHTTFSNVFPSDPAIAQALGEEPQPPSMFGSDPPRHTRLRGLVSSAFTPRIVQRLEPRMVEIANQLVDEAVAKGEIDLVEALAFPLPVIVIAEIIGVPVEDREQFKGWSEQLVENLGLGLLAGGDPNRAKHQRAVLREMSDYFLPLAEQRRYDPKPDLMTGLVQARYEGSQLDADEMLQMLTLLLVAGNETTTTLIGNTAVELMQHADAAESLRLDPSGIPTAIEEVLRFSSPIQFDPRYVTRDTTLCGAKLARGDWVLSWLGSANRDERTFERPERFDIKRRKNPHLSFGFGTHYCIGANLARLEARVAIEAVLRKTSRIERNSDTPLPLHRSPVFRSYRSIPVRLEAA